MTRFLKTILAASIVVFTSCGKESSPTNNPLPSKDSIVLSKFIVIDSVPGRGFDTTLSRNFTYDNLGRLIQVNSILVKTAFDPVKSIILEKYIYNGTDTLPVKFITESYETGNPGDIYRDTSFFTYDPASNLIADSTISYNGAYISSNTYNYVYNSGSIIRISRNSDIIFNGTDSIFQTNQNGNLAYQKTIFQSNQSVVTAITYDNHPNPFYIPAYFKTRFIEDAGNEGIPSAPQKNNATSLTATKVLGGFTYNSNVAYSYIYKTNQYPSFIYITKTTAGGTFLYKKGIFEYINH